jgi:hypothetical protein
MSIDKFIDKNNECIICFDLIDPEKQNIEIFNNCEHYNNYHVKCLNEWVLNCTNNNIIPSCPICRNIINVYNNTSDIEQNNYNIIIFQNEFDNSSNNHSICSICCRCGIYIFYSSIFIFFCVLASGYYTN